LAAVLAAIWTNEIRELGATSVSATEELAPKVAVMVALELLPTVVVVALKVADVAAAATVTDAGTVRAEFVFVSVTMAPPVGAG
jgi:antirestriction protein